ncbi:hypothetical protein B0H17DRAFT_1053914 [Mycena rosella]|uniref:Adenylate kinase n=1 Tax=Mycena rosella TaxID=1033263 RepID=A0AAD7DP96_MYCRO|nr:hypothetical protein B0H17DRAFT_1053914 [Mycena rosella]
MVPPPLFGDAQGNYRVSIVGNSGKSSYHRQKREANWLRPGVGKSTLGKQLAEILGVPFVVLDTLFWKPGWQQSTNEEMREKVLEALANAPNGWVVDGSYSGKIGSLVQDISTDVIWLDPPLALYLPRLIFRTFLRLFRLSPPCSPGCPERVSEVFLSKESIVWWCITQHRPVREREGARMAQIGMGVGANARRMGRGAPGVAYRSTAHASTPVVDVAAVVPNHLLLH